MRKVGTLQLSRLVGAFDRHPAYLGLAQQLRDLIVDGQLAIGTRLPSERELTTALDVSRTTITRAYQTLCNSGFAITKPGSGTFTTIPGGRSRAHDRALLPRPDHPDDLDLNCAAGAAPPGIAKAYAEALSELPAYLSGNGYFPRSVPRLAEAIATFYSARGLPTSPEQIVVTPGALSATAIAARALLKPRARVVVESPSYPNAVAALRSSGGRIFALPISPGGWDEETVRDVILTTKPAMVYTVPDFQNPTGHVMSSELRTSLGRWCDQAGSILLVDEAHQSLALEPLVMPPPLALSSVRAVTIGSVSKQFWGGLRIGWIRAPIDLVPALTHARQAIDLGAAVLDQLVVAKLLADPEPVLTEHRRRLRTQRDHLVELLTQHLPDWHFAVPAGGLVLWCKLPESQASQLAIAAENKGVIVSPGPVFAVNGGLNQYIRLPWTQSPPVLTEAVLRLADAWHEVQSGVPPMITYSKPAIVV